MAFPVTFTPNKVYFKNDICILCGFSFGLREVTSKGEIKERDKKGDRWPVTVERLEKVKKINLHNFDSDTTVEDLFDFVVCFTCFDKVEKILQYENEIIQLKLELTQSRENAKQLLLQPQQESSPNSPGSPSSKSPVTLVKQESSPLNSQGSPSSKSPVTLVQQESSKNLPGPPSSKPPMELQVTLVPHVLAELPQQAEPVPVFVLTVPEQEKETVTKGIITFMIIISS
ncbi:hypothetical protein SNE40_006908 [Patella caerulea]|uniref:Uncharacterized protein n=1 Tax=Patella caerulea TaxID=87958 RepID=A0AAN8JWV4_PATCE